MKHVQTTVGLFSARQAARYLAIGEHSFRRLVRAGALPAPAKILARYPKWARAALDEWITGPSLGLELPLEAAKEG